MKKEDTAQIPLRVATLLLGALPASVLALASTGFLLIPGLLRFHIIGVLWGTAALAGTFGLWRVVFRAVNRRKTVICLLAGMLAILPIFSWGGSWFTWIAMPFYMGLLSILSIGIQTLRNWTQQKKEIV